MTYREALEQYKKGTLEEAAKKKIESDIERQDALSEYLFEQDSLDLFDHTEKTEPERDSEQHFVKMVNRSIRRAFVKMGAVIGTVVLVLVLFVQFALPDIVSGFYYNPAEKVGENTNRISLDMAVYTELTMPGYDRDNVSVYTRGYGNYDICIYQNYSLNGSFNNLSGTIEQGRLNLYDINVLKKPVDNVFAWFQMQTTEGQTLEQQVREDSDRFFASAGTKEQAKETLEALPEHEKYVAYVTLNERMTYEEYMNYREQLGEAGKLNGFWCAVRVNDSGTGENGVFLPGNLGFTCELMKSTSLYWDKETYPNLLLWDETADQEWSEETIKQEAYMKQHFISQLRYMSKQEEFLAMMNEAPETYLEAADYVEEHGIEIYGFAAIGDKETLLALEEDKGVYEIAVSPLR